jgi:eukaryotic-like serine/threonine-protein kinase
VAYEALSGERAQKGRTPMEVVDRAAGGPAPDLRHDMPQAPLKAAAVLREGLAPSPQRRPDSAGELVSRLERAFGETAVPTATAPLSAPTAEIDDEAAPEHREPAPPAEPHHEDGIAPPPPSATPTAGSDSRRRWLAAVPLALAALALGAVLALTLGGDSDEPRQGANDRAAEPPPASTSTTTATEVSTVQAPPATDATAVAGGSGAELNDQGFALVQEGRYEEAVPILQQAVESFPEGSSDINYAYALFNLGNALRLAGRPDEAIPVLEQRLQIPNQTSVVQQELDLARAEAG